jgi:tRNA(Leu) C34 or U34 (ribose-2'-O)-methylase TrmL
MSDTVTVADEQLQKPYCYLILNRLRKGNVSILLRSCVAFNIKAVLLCGRVAEYDDSQLRMADHGAGRFVEVRRFARFEDAVAHLRTGPDGVRVDVCGVEIRPDAIPVDSVAPPPFNGSTAFVLGSEGDGLSDVHMALCDRFVFIPQYGNGTASLNVAIAGSIVMHRFASWAGYAAQPLDPSNQAKFLVDRSVLTPDRFRNSVAAKLTRDQRDAAIQNYDNSDHTPFEMPTFDDGDDEDEDDIDDSDENDKE